MDLVDLESQALRLSLEDRARLAEVLLASLESVSDEEARASWLEEAERRDSDIDRGAARVRPAADVFRAARERFG